MKSIKIIGLGKALPEKVCSNAYFEERLDTSDEWITKRTGIKNRHFVVEEKNYELAAAAAANAIKDAGINKEEIRYVIVSTFTPDYNTPSVACMVSKALGLPDNVMCFDLNAACSGFLYGLHTMRGLLEGEKGGYGLVIGSEVISRHLDMEDRSTCILFGDGAGAAVVKSDEDSVYAGCFGSDGQYDILHCDPYLKMNGQEVFRFAVECIRKCVDEILVESDSKLSDIDYVVCHQANSRIIDYVRTHYRESNEKFFVNVDKYGNTSAASIPIALCEMKEQGKLVRNTKTICVGFGAGLTWGAMLISW